MCIDCEDGTLFVCDFLKKIHENRYYKEISEV